MEELSGEDVDVLLLEANAYTTFQPLLYQVATGGLNPGDVTYALRTVAAQHPNVRITRTIRGIRSEAGHETWFAFERSSIYGRLHGQGRGTVRFVGLALVVAAGLSVVACSGSDESPGSGSATDVDNVTSSTVEPRELLITVTADEEGILDANLVVRPVVVDGCVLVEDADTGSSRMTAIWPYGTYFDSATQRVVLADGTAIAVGQAFNAAGGEVEAAPFLDLVDPGSLTAHNRDCVDTPKMWLVSKFSEFL